MSRLSISAAARDAGDRVAIVTATRELTFAECAQLVAAQREAREPCAPLVAAQREARDPSAQHEARDPSAQREARDPSAQREARDPFAQLAAAQEGPIGMAACIELARTVPADGPVGLGKYPALDGFWERA